MVRIKIPKNNTNNEATLNQKAKKAINPFFRQTSSEKKQQATPTLDLPLRGW